MQVLERKLDTPISMPVYRSLRDGVRAEGANAEFHLNRGERCPLYVGAPPDDKLPKDATGGRLLRVGGCI